MGSCRLQSSVITTASTSLTKSRFLEKSSFHGQVLRFTNVCKSTFRHSRKIRTLDVRAQASGITKSSSGAVEAAVTDGDLKDQNMAFVAGATGRVGSRAVRELIKLGFRVRAGVRSAQRAQTLVQSVKEMKLDVEEDKPVEKLEIVECDLEKPKEIGPALGNASVVLCCIGASEKEVFDITGPYRIDYQATKNLIDAAAAAKVNQFIMVSSLGTNKVGFPAAILNLFWGVLIWKRKAEEALIASGLPYTIVRPGGMERPTDAFKETHNLTLSKEDTLFGGLVSNLQVAELMAFMAKNPGLSYCKVVEVIAETTAPLTPMDRLLSKIPSQRVQPKESYPPAGPEVAQAKAAVTEAPVPPVEKESSQVVIRPLSPYTAYDDLRPPTSPTPSPPSAQKQSHSPVDAVPKADTSDILTISSATAPSIPDTSPASDKAKTGRPLSPYVAYDDLKPPTSPSPTPSVGSLPPTASTNGPPVASTDQHHTAEPKPRPLSPYPMYEDLKPPTSPTPSPRN